MNIYTLEFEANIVQISVIFILLIWRLVRYQNKGGLTDKLFMFGLIAHLIMNMYWMASMILASDDDAHIFKASDTSTIAFFLIWVSMFQTKCKLNIKSKDSRRIIPVTAIVFGLWNVIWWNIWNLNLITNTLWALAIIPFTYMIFYALDYSRAFTKSSTIILYVLLAVLFVFEIIEYYSDPLSVRYSFCDWTCAVVWFLFVVLMVVRAICDKPHRTSWLFAGMLFSLYAEYLIDGIRYSLFMFVETIVLAACIIFFNEHQICKEEAL